MGHIALTGDKLCDYCILLMERMSDLVGISYGTLNVWLFVVLGPLSTLTFMAASVVAKINWKHAKKISIALDILGAAIVLLVVGLIVYAMSEMPTPAEAAGSDKAR